MTALQSRKIALGRHPLLRLGTLAQRIFNYLKTQNAETGATIGQLASALLEERQSVNGCLQRMKDHGLVVVRKINKGNRIVSGYFAVTENENGHARDKLDIECTILVNEYGEYSVLARIVGESPLSHEGNRRAWHKHTFSVAVPKPTEPTKTRTLLGNGLEVIHHNKDIEFEGKIIDIKAE